MMAKSLRKQRNIDNPNDTVITSFGRLEKREWYLWSAAVVVTLLLAGGVASFLLRKDYDLCKPSAPSAEAKCASVCA